MASATSPLVRGILQGAAIAQDIKEQERRSALDDANARLAEARFRMNVFRAGGSQISPADEQELTISGGDDRLITGPTGARFRIPSPKQKAAAEADSKEQALRRELEIRRESKALEPPDEIKQAQESRAAKKAQADEAENTRAQRVREQANNLLDLADGDVGKAIKLIASEAKKNPDLASTRLSVRKALKELAPKGTTISETLAQRRAEKEAAAERKTDAVKAIVGELLAAADGDAEAAIGLINRRAKSDPDLQAVRADVRKALLGLQRRRRTEPEDTSIIIDGERISLDGPAESSSSSSGASGSGTFEEFKRKRLGAR